jgi:hypothetical protein
MAAIMEVRRICCYTFSKSEVLKKTNILNVIGQILEKPEPAKENYADYGYSMRLEALWILINACIGDKEDADIILGLQNHPTYDRPYSILTLLD